MRKLPFALALVIASLGLATAANASVEKLIANFTGQCTSPSVCGTEFLGGEWGHGVFVRDTSTGIATGEVEVAFAFHNVQGAGPLHATSWFTRITSPRPVQVAEK
jgi:hypothetical protein